MILAGIVVGASALILGGTPMGAIAVDGAALYKKQCKKCHGKKGEGKKNKKKPGKFKYQPVNGLTQEELIKSLSDYKKMWDGKSWKDKTEKKMAKATKKLDDGKIKLIADFIVTLKK